MTDVGATSPSQEVQDRENALVDVLVSASLDVLDRRGTPDSAPVSLREMLAPASGGRARGSGHGYDCQAPAPARRSAMKNRLIAVVFAKTLPVTAVRFVRLRGGHEYRRPTNASLDRLSRVLAGMCPAPRVARMATGIVYHLPQAAPFGGPRERSLAPALTEAEQVAA